MNTGKGARNPARVVEVRLKSSQSDRIILSSLRALRGFVVNLSQLNHSTIKQLNMHLIRVKFFPFHFSLLSFLFLVPFVPLWFKLFPLHLNTKPSTTQHSSLHSCKFVLIRENLCEILPFSVFSVANNHQLNS